MNAGDVAPPAAPRNALLASLPEADRHALSPGLQWVPMRLGDRLYEPGVTPSHAFFPVSAVVSLHVVTRSGATAETAGVGHEGMVGMALFMGGGSTASSAVVHTGGHGWRLEPRLLAQEFERGGALHRTLLRYAQALMTQMAQTAACYRHHSVEQQLSG